MEKSNLGRSRELAATLIDMVEDAIRQAHPKIDRIAEETVYEGSLGIPGTLLFGDEYYALEDELTKEIATAKMLPDQASVVAKAIAYGLQDSFREDITPPPAKLYRIIKLPFEPHSDVFRDGGQIERLRWCDDLQVFHTDIAERNTIVEAMHRLNRKGVVANEDVDASIAAGYQELKELHYPSTKVASGTTTAKLRLSTKKAAE